MGFCPKCGNKVDDGAVCSFCSGGGMAPRRENVSGQPGNAGMPQGNSAPQMNGGQAQGMSGQGMTPQGSMAGQNNGGQAQQGNAGYQGNPGAQAMPAVQPQPAPQGSMEKKPVALMEFFKNFFKRPVDAIADFSKNSSVLTSFLLYLITLVLSIACIPFTYLGSDIYYAIKYDRDFDATLTFGGFFRDAGYDIWSILIYGILFSLVAVFTINFLEKDCKVQFNNVFSILAMREFLGALLSVLYTIGRMIPLGVLRNSLIPSIDTGLTVFISVMAILGFAKLAKNENKSPAAYMIATLITVVVTDLIHYVVTFTYGMIFD
ncbi:MAG: hypothetical protein IKO53_03985 [Lachnospiraceae bacterium]|nr:hypothetical protein [Lachnospiraceae bacterium]